MAGLLMSIDHYEDLLGRSLPGRKKVQAERLLAAASDEVRRIAEGELDGTAVDEAPGGVNLVLFSMVTRGATNPKGLSGERIADYQAQGMRPVYATDEEQRDIRRAVGLPTVREVQFTSHLPQRLLDEAAAVPDSTMFYLGGHPWHSD